MLTLFCGFVRANGIIDPQMKILEDELSDAIVQGMTFGPNGSGGGVFGFFNATGDTITELTFETLIKPTSARRTSRRRSSATRGITIRFSCSARSITTRRTGA
jgi:hypothetical protein